MKRKPTVISVAIPPELLKKIRKIAQVEHRSLSAQVVFFLDQMVARLPTGDAK